ncbi:MAG: hypothetical protein ACI86H_001088 [bacterium]|jgi:hypothetical protein
MFFKKVFLFIVHVIFEFLYLKFVKNGLTYDEILKTYEVQMKGSTEATKE